MSVIIRLQNLPWSANALHIRQYFHGLSIPEGGVHIVGGEQGDAFIAFTTDEDARQAFNRNNGKIKEVQITLMLSSRTEMQRVIEQARSQSYAAFMPATPAAPKPLPSAVPAIVPEIKDSRKESKEKEKNDKRESRRRSRSRSRSKSRDSRERRDSRDRRDRSRDRRDRRHRRRSRSRSRDRKSSRRRERSRSKGRSHSRDRKSKDQRKRSEEKQNINLVQKDVNKSLPEVWGKQKAMEIIPPNPQPPNLLGNFPRAINQPNRSFDTTTSGFQSQRNGNGESAPPFVNRGVRDSWPPSNNFDNNFQNNRNANFRDRDRDPPDQFQRNALSNRNGPKNRQDPDNCCVALEPFCGGYGEVRRFFQGMFIGNSGIKFINDLNGRSTGLVYVRFSSRAFKEEALRMNGHFLAGARVTINHINEEEFDDASDRYNPNANEDVALPMNRNITKYFNIPDTNIKNFSCLIVDDLPTYCKEQDILHMFSAYPLLSLILTVKKRGGYIAYVKFSTPEGAKQALEETDLHKVSGKEVTVKPCSDSDFDEINQKHEVNLNATKKENIGTDCLSVSGLPEKTNDKDIADFFSDIGVIPTKIHLISTNLGFTGQAYCEFATIEEASRAAKKHETVLGKEVISVLAIKREEMESILDNTLPAPELVNPISTKIVIEPKEPEPKFLSKPQLPPLINPENLPNFNMQNSDRPPFPSHMFDMRGGNMRGGHMRGGDMRGDDMRGDDMRGGDMRGVDMRGGDMRGGDMRGGDMRGGPRFGPRGFGGNRARLPPPRDVFDDVPPGCTVYMNNVPYKATTNDILDFFEGFNHTNNVSRRYNPNNTPSDEAKIIFFEPEDAERAVRELQKARIWDRQIFLKQE